jgi:hypothetical protein
MESFKLCCLIFELNGMIKSMSELINHDEQYQNPMIENIEDKMKEIIGEIENGKAPRILGN